MNGDPRIVYWEYGRAMALKKLNATAFTPLDTAPFKIWRIDISCCTMLRDAHGEADTQSQQGEWSSHRTTLRGMKCDNYHRSSDRTRFIL
jgi:hypothetical protein